MTKNPRIIHTNKKIHDHRSPQATDQLFQNISDYFEILNNL